MKAREFINNLGSNHLSLGRGIELVPICEKDGVNDRRIRYESPSLRQSKGRIHYEISWYSNSLILMFHDERDLRSDNFRNDLKVISERHSNIVAFSDEGWRCCLQMNREVVCGSWKSFADILGEVQVVFRELYDLVDRFVLSEISGESQTMQFNPLSLTSSEFISLLCVDKQMLNVGDIKMTVLQEDKNKLWVQYHKDRFNKDVHYEVVCSSGGVSVVLHDERENVGMDVLRKRLIELAKKNGLEINVVDCPCEIRFNNDVLCGRTYEEIRTDVELGLTKLYEIFEETLEVASEHGVDAVEREQCDMELEVVAQDVLGEGKESGDVVRMISNAAVADILVARGLQVPSYQRKYCWVRKQIEGLLDSIWYFPWDVTKSDERLHLGTIVLHQTTDEKNNVVYDVVDGQQRLITLSILYRLAKVKVVDVAGVGSCMPYALLSTQVPNDDVKRHIFWAARIIREWLRAHSECEKFWLQRIQLDAIIINGSQHLGKAYTFFNAINSAGKKLTDYDLLKPHHLRYLEEDEPKGYFASSWDDFVTRKVASFGGEEALLCDELMDTTLYRLRSWSRNRKVSFENHHVFSHFRAYETIGAGPRLGIERFAYDTGLGGGKLFFEYVHRFAGMYSNFVNTNAVEALHNFDGYWRHRVLLNVIRAVLFLYYCKHRDLYLDDALVFITERLSKIRAINNSLRAKKILQDSPIVSHTVEALAESPAPEFFFRYCMMPTNRYLHTGIDDENKGHVKPAFWKAVGNLYSMVSSRMAFSTSKEYSEIIKTYGLK